MNYSNMGKEQLAQTVANERPRLHRCRQAIENFHLRAMNAKLEEGGIALGELFYWFKEMHPCIHRDCDSTSIDLPALTYALQRLPREVAASEGIYVMKNAPDANRDGAARQVFAMTPGTRRRIMYSLGKEMEFIARDNETDILDILCCLTSFGIEAEKISSRLQHDSSLSRELRETQQPLHRSQTLARLADTLCVSYDQLKRSDDSLAGHLLPFIGDLGSSKLPPSQMRIKFLQDFRESDEVCAADEWCANIVQAMKPYGNRRLAILSADDHSVANVLTGFAQQNREELQSFAQTQDSLKGVALTEEGWLYASLLQYLKHETGARTRKAKIELEGAMGVRHIADRTSTGIDVQLIDMQQMLSAGRSYDSRLAFDREKVRKEGLVLLVMDYPFGKQARHTMRNLCLALGDQMDSISILGKAGIVCNQGERYDLMFPSEIIPQISAGIYKFHNSLSSADVPATFKGKVHTGRPMVTVPGTAMQNDLVFCHYLSEYDIIGVEMEAAPYFDTFERLMGRRLKENLLFNVGYWASDKPLDPTQSLAANHLTEGYASLYTLVTTTLNKVLTH